MTSTILLLLSCVLYTIVALTQSVEHSVALSYGAECDGNYDPIRHGRYWTLVHIRSVQISIDSSWSRHSIQIPCLLDTAS